MPKRRRIAVLTTGRQDYAILRSTMLALTTDERFELLVFASGMHLREEHGRSIEQLSIDGFEVTEEIPLDDANPAVETGSAVGRVFAALQRHRPDALMLLGDRSETLGAALAATLATIPIIHLHGGEETEGAIDNAMRHAITKLAHLHLVSHEQHAMRVRQMGEPDDRVVVVGAPGLDNLLRGDLPNRESLERDLGLQLLDPVVLVTLHPTTLGESAAASDVTVLGDALARVNATYVITLPNADSGGASIRDTWAQWAAGRRNVCLVPSLGPGRYWGMMRIARAMIGNSSSALIEGPSLGLSVVDVGDRQKWRLAPPHVVRVPFDREAVRQALVEALSDARRLELAGVPPVYLPGPAAPRIVAAIARTALERPPRKRFVSRLDTERPKR
ncbi:MAG: UDP-N-acetylglucosamine 2-epimerase (hydrolyzing) [Deltaproteobacteria bacterium]|nr:UDP-N-acetylglucosamine 2-epimerase (hydrolyzing) [Deltaproteobacteria bacterium]